MVTARVRQSPVDNWQSGDLRFSVCLFLFCCAEVHVHTNALAKPFSSDAFGIPCQKHMKNMKT